MTNRIKQEMNKIEIPKELSGRSQKGVSQAKKEMKSSSKNWNIKGIGIVASFVIAIGAFTFIYNTPNNNAGNQNEIVITDDGSVNLPALQLPEDNTSADMIGLIVYNGKIYTQTSTEIDTEKAKSLTDEKLGTTKGTIDEWSKQEDYETEFASTTGITDVYSVKGYDKGFRIMTFQEINGEVYAEFYENLNGITITSGADILGKLNLEGNISSAQYRLFSDWEYSIENYQPITDLDTINKFAEELNHAKPLPRSLNSDPIGTSRSNEQFRELLLELNDGSKVSLKLLKDGYVYYGFMDAYFQVNEEVFSKMWSLLD